MVTVSIVSHRQGTLVAALLQDIARTGSGLVSAVVVTRNVDEPAIAIPAALTAVTTIVDNAVPAGFGANHNAAFAHCTTPYFAVVNPDIRLTADPFAALVREAKEGATGAPGSAPAVGATVLVAPRIVAPDGRDEDAARQLMTPWRLLRRRLLRGERRATDAFDWLAGMFLVIRSDAFAEVGGFDARYFMYCEDFDLCARLRLRGWTLVRTTGTRVIHDAQRASHRSVRHLMWHVSSLTKMWLSSAFWRYRALLAASPR